MDIETIKRGLRSEIKKRENEQYFTFQTNIREMCKDCLAKIEELEAENESLKKLNSKTDHLTKKCERCGFPFTVPQATLKMSHIIRGDLNFTRGLCMKCASEIVDYLNKNRDISNGR